MVRKVNGVGDGGPERGRTSFDPSWGAEVVVGVRRRRQCGLRACGGAAAGGDVDVRVGDCN